MRSYRTDMYPFDAVVTFAFFVPKSDFLDKMIGEVEGFLALLGRFVTQTTEQIDGPRVCCRREFIVIVLSWVFIYARHRQTRGPSFRLVFFAGKRLRSAKKPSTSSMML